MRDFRYIAKTGSGERVEGVIEGKSREGVSRSLLHKGLFPIQIIEAYPESGGLEKIGLLMNLWKKWSHRELGSQSLALFTRRLGDLLEAGLPMQKAVNQLCEQTREKTLRRILHSVAFRVKSGESLSQSLSGYGNVFPNSLIGAIQAGETGGGLTTILHGLAELYEKEDDLKRSVRAALLYPTMVILVSLATMTVMFLYLLPKLSTLYNDMGQTLPASTQFLIDASSYFQRYGAITLVLFGLVLFTVVFLHNRSEKMQRMLALLILKTPFIGRIVLNREIIRFAHTLSSLVGGGVPLMRGLWFASRSSGNSAIMAELGLFGQQVGEGASLSSVVSGSRIGDSVLVMMIQIGEEMGDLAQSLEKACRIYERELAEKMKIVTTVLEPMLIVSLGLIVGFIVFSMMLPIMEIDLV